MARATCLLFPGISSGSADQPAATTTATADHAEAGTAEPVTASTSSGAYPMVLLVDHLGHSNMAVPSCPCDTCGVHQQLQPQHVCALPGTPVQPTVLYSYGLLEEARHTKLHAPIGVRAFCEIYPVQQSFL